MTDKDSKKIQNILQDTSKVENMQNAVDLLSENYADRITIQGQEQFGVLIAVYCIAEDNILSGTVLHFLQDIDNTEALKELANNEFFTLAEKQHKKTAFREETKQIFKHRKEQQKQEEQQKRAEYLEIKANTMPSYYNKQFSQYIVECVLKEGLNIEVKFNLVTKKIEVHGSGKAALLEPQGLYSESNIINALPLLILDECKACEVTGTPNSTKIVQAYLLNIADINRYNPIQDMLLSHKNTDSTHLEKIYKILNVTAEFDKTLIKKWLIQTVAFAFATYYNQVSTEGMLVLQGMQGLAKTSFFRKLVGNPLWFNEGVCIDTASKDSLINAVSAWVCELGEIDSTLKKDQSALKAFITNPLDRIRLPYAATVSDMPRTTSLCGTVNPDKFLKDDTGNRRYWIIHVDSIDKKLLFNMSMEEVFEMWGYIYSLYLENPKAYLLNDIERQKVELRNIDYMVNRKYELEIRYFFDFTKSVDKWEWVEPAKVAQYFRNISAEQIGRVFAAVEKEERDVQKKRTMKGVAYLLPMDWHKIPNYSNGYSNYC